MKIFYSIAPAQRTDNEPKIIIAKRLGINQDRLSDVLEEFVVEFVGFLVVTVNRRNI